MNLYQLDEQFNRSVAVDSYSTLIWTERYSEAGECSFTSANTRELRQIFREGSLFAIEGSNEVMLIDTVKVEQDKLTASGRSLLYFLNSRIFRVEAYSQSGHTSFKYSGNKPQDLMTQIVDLMCTNNTTMNGYFGNLFQKIANLTTYADPTISVQPIITVAVPYGSLYTALKTLAEPTALGQTLELLSASPGTYSLRYRVYQGRDLTSEQTTYPAVLFASSVDTLQNVSELYSIAAYANVAYATPTSIDAPDLSYTVPFGYAEIDGARSLPDFQRRVLQVAVDDLQADSYTSDAAGLQAVLNKRALDALLNNYIRAVDGEVTPQSIYQLNRDYKLGDIIELQSISGNATKARVTEIIRSKDSSGERVFPTISAIG